MQHSSSRAFSLLELSIALGVMAVLATAILPIGIRAFQIKAAEKTAEEIRMIQEACRLYHAQQGNWPLDIAALQTNTFLPSSWNAINPWNNPYQITSSVNQLTISSQVPNLLTSLVASRLTAAVISGDTVSSSISLKGGSSSSAGIIVAWSGPINSIPAGWVLCDGNNGTPDLRDKFIIGARQDEVGVAKSQVTGILNVSGGSIQHDHGGQTHLHQLTISQMPKHHHGYMATPWTGSRYDGHSSPLMTQQMPGQTEDTGGDQGHRHGINTEGHLPPFYALAFIMKL